MAWFVKIPDLWATANVLSPTFLEMSDIDTSLRYLYWFNLWFAVEKDMNDIRSNVVKALVANIQKSRWLDEERDCVTIESLRINITSEIESLLSDIHILERAKMFADYKYSVEKRAANSDFWKTSTSL